MCAKTSPSTAVLPSVPVRPQKDGAVPSWLRTDGTVDNTGSDSVYSTGITAKTPGSNDRYRSISGGQPYIGP